MINLDDNNQPVSPEIGKPVLTETVKKHSQRSFMAKRRRALLPCS